MSANSVLAPHDGMMRPESNEYLAGAGRKELSECQSRSPSLKNQTRSSTDMILLAIQVREIGAARAEAMVLALADVAGALVVLELAEIQRERDLLLVREVLIAKDEHGIRIHPRLDRRHVHGADRFGDVQPRDLSRERATQRVDRYGHGDHSLQRRAAVTSCRGRSSIAGRYYARSRWAPATTPGPDRRCRPRHAPPSRGSRRGETSAPRRAPR